LMPERWNASSTFRRLAIFLILVRIGGFQFATQGLDLGIQIQTLQQFAYGFGTHHGDEFVAVLVFLVQEVFFGQQLAVLQGSCPDRSRRMLRSTARVRCRAGSCPAPCPDGTAGSSGTRCARSGWPVRCGPCARDAPWTG
jgi:hypothetical protein